MSLSEATLRERYSHLSPREAIKQMIEDMVDTSVIMQVIDAWGRLRYTEGKAAGAADAISRSYYRPGDGDMGG